MATPADQRLLELLDKWLKSLELHLKYASLDDDSYSQIQPWPEHQRPSRWIVDLAKQKAAALKAQVEDRVKMGDAKFSDSLELMTFLANLVGAEHIERFIPLANADTERAVVLAPPEGQPDSGPANAATGTREMPKFVVSKPRTPPAAGTAEVARTERRTADVKVATKVGPKPPANPAPADEVEVTKPSSTRAADAARSSNTEQTPDATRDLSPAAVHEQVIADAARLVQWGRKWYELAELIASMADRPSLIDVRRILKDNKTVIEKKAGRG
jgi:hypothetical protein